MTCTQIEATSSGHFEVTTGGITINANVVMNSSYAVNGGVRCTHNTGTVTINGTVTGGSVTNGNAIGNNGAGTLTINGNCTGGPAANATVRNASTGTVNVVGNMVGVGPAGQNADANGTFNITGNITGGNGINAYGFNHSGGTLNVTGNVTGGSNANAAYGIYANHGTGKIVTITGNVAGYSGNGSEGIYIASTGTVIVSGTCTGGGGASAHGLRNNSTGTATLNEIIGGTVLGATGVYSANASSVTTFKKATAGTNGYHAYYGPAKMVVDAALNTATFKRSSDGTDYTLSNDYPAVTNVKSGVVYNLTTLTGTYTGEGGHGESSGAFRAPF